MSQAVRFAVGVIFGLFVVFGLLALYVMNLAKH